MIVVPSGAFGSIAGFTKAVQMSDRKEEKKPAIKPSKTQEFDEEGF